MGDERNELSRLSSQPPLLQHSATVVLHLGGSIRRFRRCHFSGLFSNYLNPCVSFNFHLPALTYANPCKAIVRAAEVSMVPTG